jgi:hypothetical protein
VQKLKGASGAPWATWRTDSIDDHFDEIDRLRWLPVRGWSSGLAQAIALYVYNASGVRS